jgi:hypothetical protein
MSAPQIRDLQIWENLTGVSFLYLQRNQSRFYLAQYRTDGKFLLIERTKQQTVAETSKTIPCKFFYAARNPIDTTDFLKLKKILNTVRFKFSYE